MISRTASSEEVAEMLAEEFLPAGALTGGMSSNVTTSGGFLAVTKDTP